MLPDHLLHLKESSVNWGEFLCNTHNSIVQPTRLLHPVKKMLYSMNDTRRQSKDIKNALTSPCSHD